ncbi:RrF2 family transcriptional regulator [Thermosynechococcaceae cyanobacterium Okahandja]
MTLTTRGHYSIKALLDLSLQPQYGPASVRAIAERQHIPAPYLEKLLIDLRRAGLVRSLRGVYGGYQLARPPHAISLRQILAAVGESPEPLFLKSPQSEDAAADWVTRSLWQRLHQKLQEALDTISLEDLYFDARSWQAAQGDGATFVI